MRRRKFLGVLGGALAAWPLASRAQQRATPLIGILGPQAGPAPYGDAVVAGLLDLGYEAGRNVRIEARWANGKFDQLPKLATELVHLNVDAIVASLTEASLQAKKATPTIPIVMAGVGDPVGSGLVASLARPGGNVTGTSGLTIDAAGKQVELLKEVLQDITAVAIIGNPANPMFQSLQSGQLQQGARTAGVQVQLLEIRAANEIDTAFSNVKLGTRALVVPADPLFVLHAARIAEAALKKQLITVSNTRLMANAGILLAYGSNHLETHRRAAAYVDKILKGARPADLPVEQPTKFELVINLKTAKTLGITIPPTLLARADEVIE
jgi:putative ABC transport system substrate-binding protein